MVGNCEKKRQTESLKYAKRARESVGASAREDAMVAAAARAVKSAGHHSVGNEGHASDSSSSDGEDDFAHRVRLAHSFECGARDARLAAGLSDEPLETQAPSGPLSRRAYASGARAAEVAAKVEAQMLAWQAATQPEVQVSSGLSVTVTPKVPAGANRYPDELVALAPTPTRGMLEEPAKRPPSICTDLPEAGPCMVPAPQHRMQHARVVAHHLFTR